MRRKLTDGRFARMEKAKAFDILADRFYDSMVPFCDLNGRCWIVVGDIKKPISSEEYHSLKEAGL